MNNYKPIRETVKIKIGGYNRIFAKGQAWSWNNAYHLYNSESTNAQLTWWDLGVEHYE